MGDMIPMDVWHEVLKRLPVKSVSQLCCVCKTWLTHIRSAHFVDAHHKAKSKSSILLANMAGYSLDRCGYLSNYQVKQQYLIIDDIETNVVDDELVFPVKFPPPPSRPREPLLCFQIVACVNGLLLLTVYLNKLQHTILWNPVIGWMWMFLPEPNIIPPERTNLSGLEAFGFGYDPTRNDFRVVRLLYLRPSTRGCTLRNTYGDFHQCGENRCVSVWDEKIEGPVGEGDDLGWPSFADNAYHYYPPEVEVYYVRERTWKRLHIVKDHQMVITTFPGITPSLQCYMNGCVHWVARTYICTNNRQHSYTQQVLVFNFETERFDAFKLPDQLIGGVIRSVSEIGGWLSVLDYTRCDATVSCCSIWSMRGYGDVASWAKMLTIPLSTCFDRVLWVTDDRVLVSDKNGQLMVYDPVSGHNWVLGFKPDGNLGLAGFPYACAFKESLYLLPQQQQQQQQQQA